ncbi:MAG: cell cycle protein MesJ, tRNA(Ile)-lysidine synthase [Parcubacteria group bacterium GW2011_GWC1_45_14]|nr:MAG: cell cycle protein MesJ, tRNA(Ile)-lysidine synthase [Parcubacteria group bacterium GW2011_GWC1_45_14]
MPNLVKKIQNFSHQNSLWEKGDKIVVGVSGGADSVCLFHIFLFLAKKYDFSLHVAHVNYGLRGQASDLDEKFVRDLAEKNALEISVFRAEKPLKKANLENSLRKVRYDFFEKIRKELNFDHIAVAHNQDDQAETVLLRLIRGSGMEGISSIKAKNGKIIRPLLATSRKEIIAYLRSQKIKFRTDKTNLEPVFNRNKVRLGLIPYLEKNFNPAAKETLANFAQTAAEDYDFIDAAAKRAGKIVEINDGVAKFDCKRMLALHGAVRRQVLRRVIREIRSGLLDIESGHLEEIEKIIKSTKNKSQKSSFKGLRLTRKGDILNILHEN